MVDSIPDFTLKQNFPISSVIDAAQRNAALQQQARQQGNQSLIDGLQTIGQVGQSLVDQRRQIAQAMILGQQFGMTPQETQGLSPEQVLQVGTIKKGQVDMGTLLNILKASSGVPSASTANPLPIAPLASTPAPIKPEATLVSTSPTIPIQSDSDIAPPAPNPNAVPIQVPPSKPQMVNAATAQMAYKAAMANRPEKVMTQDAALTAGEVPKGTKIVNPHQNDGTNLRETEFYQREWDKILKETDPLTTSSRTPLGLASRANFQANRALQTLSNPVVTNQEAGNVMADVAGIYQNGSPTQFGMSHQAYDSLYSRIQGVKQLVTGKPQDALTPEIKNRLIGVLGDMKTTNAALLHQRLDETEKSKQSVLKRFPQEWHDYRQILEGNQDAYNGLGAKTPVAQNGLTPAEQAEFDQLHKKFGNQ